MVLTVVVPLLGVQLMSRCSPYSRQGGGGVSRRGYAYPLFACAGIVLIDPIPTIID